MTYEDFGFLLSFSIPSVITDFVYEVPARPWTLNLKPYALTLNLKP